MMKRKILCALIGVLLANLIMAQGIVTTRPQKKAVILEEYTGINCPACPYGHTAAENIVSNNPGKAFIINIHNGSYANPNSGQPDFRTPFGSALQGQTNLAGYPSATINRQLFNDLNESGGTALYHAKWAQAAARIFTQSSPVNVGVSTTYDDETREVSITVEAYYVEGLPFGLESNFIQVAILESDVIGYQAGAGDSYNHKHILRHLVTGQWGDEITNIEQGSLITRTYTYTLEEDFIPENCSVVAFITETKQRVITGAETPVIFGWHNGEIEPDFGRLITNNSLQVGLAEQNSEFDVTLINGIAEEQNMILTLTYDAPEDWIINFTVNEDTFTEIANINMLADEVINVKISVKPNQNPGVAHCVLTLKSNDMKNADDEKTIEVFVAANVDNLIVNGSGNINDVTSEEYAEFYKSGLNAAGCSSLGAIPGYTLEQAYEHGLLDNVKNLYFNVGGTLPVLTVEQTNVLSNFIDAGGNLLMAGQDIGQDIFRLGGFSTSITQKLFYQHYLSASFRNEGDGENNLISAISDSIYSGISELVLYDTYQGNFSPDAIKAYGDAYEVLFYPNGKAAAVKSYKEESKIVYFAFGLEQVQNQEAREDLIDRTYRWFEGWQGSSVENQTLIKTNTYPNPVTNKLLLDTDKKVQFAIFNATGQMVKKGSTQNEIDVSELENGLFIIQIDSDNGKSINKFTKIN
ncbi:MAG: Omp28-related outer membrane protein [Bacteroidales bacterium]|nr:Omp28-related outer membrane protein [Bacteroidales bacterium]